MSLSGYSQKILQESDFPVKIIYQGKQRILVTLSQVDSLNIAYSYLDECREYADTLETVVLNFNDLIEQGKIAEAALRTIINNKNLVIDKNNDMVFELEKELEKEKKKLKFFKLSTNILGGVAAVLLIIILL